MTPGVSNESKAPLGGYQPYGYQEPVSSQQPHEEPAAAPSTTAFQPVSYGYEPSLNNTSVSETGVNHADVTEGASSGYEPPTFQPYGYEPPSYEPDLGPSAEENDDEPKPKKKSFMDDDDDDFGISKPKEKSKAEKDRENEEMFRKAAEEDGESSFLLSFQQNLSLLTIRSQTRCCCAASQERLGLIRLVQRWRQERDWKSWRSIISRQAHQG